MTAEEQRLLEQLKNQLTASREKSMHWYDLLRQYRHAVKLYDDTREKTAYGVKIIFDQFVDGIIEQTEEQLKRFNKIIEPHEYVKNTDSA